MVTVGHDRLPWAPEAECLADLDRMIVPYSETQVVYERRGDLERTGDHDGPTEAEFWFVEAEDDIDPDSDQPRERR